MKVDCVYRDGDQTEVMVTLIDGRTYFVSVGDSSIVNVCQFTGTGPTACKEMNLAWQTSFEKRFGDAVTKYVQAFREREVRCWWYPALT